MKQYSKIKLFKLHLNYFTQAQTNKLYYATYMHQNNNGKNIELIMDLKDIII